MRQLVPPRLSAQLQRRTQAHAYTDTATYIGALDPAIVSEYGQPSGTATETTIECSFTDKPNAERWRGDVDIEMLAAEIRFTSPVPSKGGRIRITKRFSEAVAERTFEVIGIQDRGAFGFVCALKTATL
jgi:hypothetical protein